jgi:hypothetical protein
MEIKLSFQITLASGEQTVQEISVPADPGLPFDAQARALMQTMLSQYATVGLLRQSAGKYTLLCASQIAMVECELPSILIASAVDVPKVPIK